MSLDRPHSVIEYPDHIEPARLDKLLAAGWYRVGQTMMTCRFILGDGWPVSVVWTRLPLESFTFRPSLKRILSKVLSKYRLVVGPVQLDAAHESLYSRYLTVVGGRRPESLRQFLFGGSPHDAFETQELSLWDGDRLVAFSWFDLGETSLQSLIGVYDPELKRESLGFASMLLEIQLVQQKNLRFHYSGYVLCGDASMDYKLRVGPELEVLDPDTDRWRSSSFFFELDPQIERIERALVRVRDQLTELGVPSRIEPYAMYEAAYRNPKLEKCLTEPLLLVCHPDSPRTTTAIVTWDLQKETYDLLHCIRAVGRVASDDPELGKQIVLWVRLQRWGTDTDPITSANTIKACHG